MFIRKNRQATVLYNTRDIDRIARGQKESKTDNITYYFITIYHRQKDGYPTIWDYKDQKERDLNFKMLAEHLC